MRTAYFRKKTAISLSETEYQNVTEIMETFGLESIPETIRFLISFGKQAIDTPQMKQIIDEMEGGEE